MHPAYDLETKRGPVVIPPETTGGVHIKCWAKDGTSLALEDGALKQAIAAAQLPCAFNHVALMPDAHTGFGIPVGTVLALKEAICPNAVGVDIGCGMCAWETGIHISEIDVDSFMKRIRELIPVGTGGNRQAGDAFLTNDWVRDVVTQFETRYLLYCDTDLPSWDVSRLQVGTLGSGNHFFELQTDDKGYVWIMLHSGSRGLGAKTAKKYHEMAVDVCKKYHTKLPNFDLAFLPVESREGDEYIRALSLAQDYAYLNRYTMMRAAQCAMNELLPIYTCDDDFINIHHNYATQENHFGSNIWIHRKGATLARKDTVGIIPGSMCSKSYIVQGRENALSFNSCSHGAGRNFSRTEAKKRIASGVDANQETQLGSVKLFCSGDARDELGSAYKSIDTVMANQSDLVDITTELSPVAVIKG